MRRFTSKPDNTSAVQQFIQSGGKVKTVKAKVKPMPRQKNHVEMVEIEVDLLPPQLRRFCV